MREIQWQSYHFDFQDIKAEEEEETTVDFDDSIVSELSELFPSAKDMPVIQSSAFGMFRMDDSMNPFKNFEFWTGHTNFDIDQDVSNIIDKCKGVEVLLVITRYRFIIGVAKLFKFRDICADLKKQLCHTNNDVGDLLELIDNPEIKIEAENLYQKLLISKYWAMYILPNGHIEYAMSDSEDDKFIEKFDLFEQSSTLTGGFLITSYNDHE